MARNVCPILKGNSYRGASVKDSCLNLALTTARDRFFDAPPQKQQFSFHERVMAALDTTRKNGTIDNKVDTEIR